jgi:hypothetical protein
MLGGLLRARALEAVDDQGNTLQNTAITIPVLSNDSGGSNQLAILQVTRPAHGTVLVNSDVTVRNAELSRLFQFAAVQLSNSVVQIANTNSYPRSTLTNGTWKISPVTDWVSGFFPGAMWYLYEQTGDAHFLAWARQWTAGIASQQYVTNTDDVGFMLNTSFGNGYRLTGDPAYEAILVQGARSLSNRFNPVVGCLADDRLLQPPQFEVILDTMMNSALLYRGDILSTDPTLSSKAISHAVRTMTNQVRADNSTFHKAIYSTTTGALLSLGTRAGASDSSTWARGHAWAIYGFAMAYRETGDLRFLNTSQRCADYYLTNVPSDYVPYWDFQAPGIPNAPRDSSAAAITLSALLQLSQVATNLQDSARYWQGARQILSSLGSSNYLAQGSTSSGILLHGTGEPPQLPNPEVDVSLIYGDYYFIEALRRYADIYRQTTLTYIPSPDFSGTDSFAYEACDSEGNCSTATVTMVVEQGDASPFSVQITLSPDTRFPSLSFPTTAGRVYQVQYTDDVAALVPWNSLVTNLSGSGFPMSLSDTNIGPSRFYRVGAR